MADNLLGGAKGSGRGPPADIFAKNPEWFWPRNASVYGQLCWSNDSLISVSAAAPFASSFEDRH